MSNSAVRILEEGKIRFAYRPKIDADVVRGMDDVQRLFMVLEPDEDRHRLIVIGRKKLPEMDPNQRHWGVVEIVSEDEDPILAEFAEYEYQTKTRGTRKQKAVRMIAEGRYAITLHEEHTHLSFRLENTQQPKEVREEFHIEREGNFILTVKNPSTSAPPFYGASYSGEADYPPRLRQRFGGYTFMPCVPVELLDYRDSQIVLIGADHFLM